MNALVKFKRAGNSCNRDFGDKFRSRFIFGEETFLEGIFVVP